MLKNVLRSRLLWLLAPTAIYGLYSQVEGPLFWGLTAAVLIILGLLIYLRNSADRETLSAVEASQARYHAQKELEFERKRAAARNQADSE